MQIVQQMLSLIRCIYQNVQASVKFVCILARFVKNNFLHIHCESYCSTWALLIVCTVCMTVQCAEQFIGPQSVSIWA